MRSDWKVSIRRTCSTLRIDRAPCVLATLGRRCSIGLAYFRGALHDAKALQRPLEDNAIAIIARGLKGDGEPSQCERHEGKHSGLAVIRLRSR